MSLIYRKKSTIFNQPQATSYKLQIQDILNSYKKKLRISQRSISSNKKKMPQRLSLDQAKKLQNLHKYTVSRQIEKCQHDPTRMRNHFNEKSSAKKPSLNRLLDNFDRNCSENTIQVMNTVGSEKMDLFRDGVYYRSFERPKGVGVKQLQKDSLLDYYHFQENPQFQDAHKTINSLKTTSTIRNFSNIQSRQSRTIDPNRHFSMTTRRSSKGF